MIDEKKLIEEIEEYTLSVYGCDINDIVAFQTNNESESAYIVQGICEAIDFIKQQEKVGEWIPVSERLPNEEEFKKDEGRFMLDDGNRRYQGFFDIHDGCFKFSVHMSGLFPEFVEDKDVIAWQPLPEPYQNDEQEEKR